MVQKHPVDTARVRDVDKEVGNVRCGMIGISIGALR